MEILFKAIDNSEGKLLSIHLARHGHAVTWQIDTTAALKELAARVWDIDVVICRINPKNPTEALKFADAISDLRAQRGYHHRPFIVLISSHINEVLYKAAALVGAALWMADRSDYEKLFSYLNVIREQELQTYLTKPCLVIRHEIKTRPNIYCDEEERLDGISLQCHGRERETDQTPETAVFIDYLCRQRYAKSEEEISRGIASSRFYMAQLQHGAPPTTAMRQLVKRSRDFLESELKATQSKMAAQMLIQNVPGHRRMYKFNGLAKIVHVREPG
jgi:hypothetical protein